MNPANIDTTAVPLTLLVLGVYMMVLRVVLFRVVLVRKGIVCFRNYVCPSQGIASDVKRWLGLDVGVFFVAVEERYAWKSGGAATSVVHCSISVLAHLSWYVLSNRLGRAESR